MPISIFSFYDDTDVIEVLEERLIEEGLDNQDIHVLGPMSSKVPGQLASYVKGNREAHPNGRILLIPYNIVYSFMGIGSGHWVGILLEYDANGTPKRAEYMDSMLNPPTPAIIREISDIDRRFNLIPKEVTRQFSLTSCGAHTIENLIRRAVNDKPLKFQGTMSETRAKHYECKQMHAERISNPFVFQVIDSDDDHNPKKNLRT